MLPVPLSFRQTAPIKGVSVNFVQPEERCEAAGEAPGDFKSAALDIQRCVEERGRHVATEIAPCGTWCVGREDLSWSKL